MNKNWSVKPLNFSVKEWSSFPGHSRFWWAGPRLYGHDQRNHQVVMLPSRYCRGILHRPYFASPSPVKPSNEVSTKHKTSNLVLADSLKMSWCPWPSASKHHSQIHHLVPPGVSPNYLPWLGLVAPFTGSSSTLSWHLVLCKIFLLCVREQR